jgi:hypothetical protein
VKRFCVKPFPALVSPRLARSACPRARAQGGRLHTMRFISHNMYSCLYRKLDSAIMDEVRRVRALIRCLHAGWRDGSERLCQETDESSTHYNKRHTSSASGVSALRSTQPYGRRTRVGSIRSIFRRSHSAKARAMGLSRMPMARNRWVTAAP